MWPANLLSCSDSSISCTPPSRTQSRFLSRRRSRCSIWVWLFDFVVDADTSLRMSRSWKECRHLAPDVSILERVSSPHSGCLDLERVSVTGPGCIREGCMSCVVISTYVSMSTYVSCTGMSRRTYGSCKNCVYKEGVSRVFSSSSLHATSCILFGISTSSAFPPYPPFPYLHIGDAHLALPISVRHVRPTLSVSLFDTSI